MQKNGQAGTTCPFFFLLGNFILATVQATTNYVWDGQNMVYEYNGTNTAGGTPYYYGLTLISLKNDAYYLYNAHGDVVQLVVSGGSLGWNYEYDAFGNETTLREIDANPFRYAGQYYDKETGTYYLRARYYDPSVGRFTQQDGWQFADPSDPLSLNLYTYCGDNPIKYSDPSGQSFKDILAGFVQAVDNSMFGGKISKFVAKIKGYDSLSYLSDSDYDYYLGKVIGSGFSYIVGIRTIISGLTAIGESLGDGTFITFISGGGAAGAGIAISVAGVAVGTVVAGCGIAISYRSSKNFSQSGSDFGELFSQRLTTKEATEIAKQLGYEKIKETSHGQPVFYNSKTKTYITPDVDRHNGGVWKMADSVKNLGKRSTRMGTYDLLLNRIGD